MLCWQLAVGLEHLSLSLSLPLLLICFIIVIICAGVAVVVVLFIFFFCLLVTKSGDIYLSIVGIFLRHLSGRVGCCMYRTNGNFIYLF